MPQGAIPPEVQGSNPAIRTLEFSNACKLEGGVGPFGVTLFEFFCFGGSYFPTLAPKCHFSSFRPFLVILLVAESEAPYHFDLRFSLFSFFLIFSGEKRVLHYTYSEGAPLPTAQNKALQPLFFMPYSCFAFLLCFSCSFLIIFRIEFPTLGH